MKKSTLVVIGLIVVFVLCCSVMSKIPRRPASVPAMILESAVPSSPSPGPILQQDEPMHTVIPLPSAMPTLRAYDIRGGNAGYLAQDPMWRGGWLGLNLP